MERFLRNVAARPVLVLALVILATAVLGWRLPHLKVHTSIYDLTIEDLPENVRYQKFKDEFGSEEIILVVARTDRVFDPETFGRLERLSDLLAREPGVERVIGLPGIKRDIDVAGDMTLEEFEHLIGPVKLFPKILISEDGRTTALSLILNDEADKEELVDRVGRLIEAESRGEFWYQIGLPPVARALARFTEKDFLTLPPVTFLVITLVLLLLFRDLRGILVTASTLLTALVWTFGLMAWTGTPLAMLTMIAPIFLIAVGTAYCMHVLSEYRRTAAGAADRAEAAALGVSRVSFPTTLAVATTVIGLGSLLVNKIQAIREFAVFSAAGILAMLILIHTLLPAVLALLPPPRARARRKKRDPFDRLLAWVTEINLNRQALSLGIIGALTVAALGGVFLLRVENSPVEYFRKTTPISQRFHDVYRDMAGSVPINVVVDSGREGYFQGPDHLALIERFQGRLESVNGVDKSESLADYLKLVAYASNRFEPEFYALPEEDFEVRMLANNFETLLGRDFLARFVSPDYSRVNIVLRTHLSSSTSCLEAEREIEALAQSALPADLKVETTGFGLVMAHSSHLLTSGQVRSLSLTLALVFGIMFLLFLSVKVGLIAMVPNFFPIVVNFGVMGWLGLELSAVTSLIASVAIGLAVDDTIHYLFRYNREFKKDLDKDRALRATVADVGRPIVFTTLTIGLGFAVLLFSSFQPTAVFGLMMVITMFSALVGDLFLLPALMRHVELVTLWDLVRLKLGRDPQEGIRLFQGLSRSQVHYVLMAGALRRLEAGQVLFRRGETSDSMYAILSGDLEVIDLLDNGGLDGPRRLMAQLKAGDVVGEMGMVRSAARSATVVAHTDVELLEVNQSMLKRLTWLYPPTAQRFFFNLLGILCDRLEQANACLSEAATVDFPTGLYFRRHFLKELDREIERARRYDTPLCVVVMDLAESPEFGPEGGICTGDEVLGEVGAIIDQQVRCTDLACRWSGRQFAVLMAATPMKEAQCACRRLAEVLSAKTGREAARPLDVGAVFGMASLAPGSDETAENLVQRACRDLERAKRGPEDGGGASGG